MIYWCLITAFSSRFVIANMDTHYTHTHITHTHIHYTHTHITHTHTHTHTQSGVLLLSHQGYVSPGPPHQMMVPIVTLQNDSISPDSGPGSPPLPEQELRRILLQQIEYYFSKDNLTSDKYLGRLKCESVCVCHFECLFIFLHYLCCSSFSNGWGPLCTNLDSSRFQSGVCEIGYTYIHEFNAYIPRCSFTQFHVVHC